MDSLNHGSPYYAIFSIPMSLPLSFVKIFPSAPFSQTF